MPRASDGELLALLTMRLRTLVDEPAISARTGLAPEQLAPILRGLGDQGLARCREGRASGWMLTPAGREQVGARLADELDAAGARDAVGTAYRSFLTVNQPLLELCSRWQVRTVAGADVPNDHTDVAHDAAVLDDLAAVDDVGRQVSSELAAELDRFGGYGRRLAAARHRVDDGEADWLTSPTLDSYHTVWFELHEDLLATLGIERGREPLDSTTPLQEAR
jgi:hypothetical protein